MGIGTCLKMDGSVRFILPSFKMAHTNTYTDFSYIPTTIWLFFLMHPFFAQTKHKVKKNNKNNLKNNINTVSFNLPFWVRILLVLFLHTPSLQFLAIPKKAQKMLTNPVSENKRSCRWQRDITWSKQEIAMPGKRNGCTHL